MTVRQRRLLMMLVLAGTLAVSAIAASSASAIIKQLPNDQVVSYEPLRNGEPLTRGEPARHRGRQPWTTTAAR